VSQKTGVGRSTFSGLSMAEIYILYIYIYIYTLTTGWTVRGSNRGGGRDFPHLSRPTLGPTQPPVQWVPVFTGGKVRPGCAADHSLPSSAEVTKE
jgi:hypothetical protein